MSPNLTSELRRFYNIQKPHTVRTPLLECHSLSQLINGTVFIKAENLQKTGAFKFRGALSRLDTLTSVEKEQGVIAYSSGNFARGLATAGQILGIKTHIVMPSDAPEIKIQAARQAGAEVILCRKLKPSREEAASIMAREIAEQKGYSLLHPFDDLILICGQASVTVELLEQFQSLETSCDSLICPTGGGSLVSGAHLAIQQKNTSVQLFSAEPQDYAGLKESLQKGRISRGAARSSSLCDALQALQPGNNNFDLLKASNLIPLAIQQVFIIKAVQLAFRDLKLVLEPSGAIAIAAVMQFPELFEGQTICAVASGGNIDGKLYQELLN